MSHLLHNYIAEQLSQRLTKSRVVVWYDPRTEFETFVSELGGVLRGDGLSGVSIGDSVAVLAKSDGSLYSLRNVVEPLVAVDDPQCLVLYLPAVARDAEGSVLMELELAGCRWEPQLRHLARNAFRQRYTDGVVDELLGRERLSYEDLATVSTAESGAPPSVLKQLLGGSTGDAQLASWLAQVDLDAIVVEKEAISELEGLVRSRLGIDLPDGDLSKWRSVASRFVLATEFLSDLAGDRPSELEQFGAVSPDVERNARSIARALRDAHANSYTDLADRAERELGLYEASVDALSLGAIDTFRFEESALLRRCAALIVSGDFLRVQEIAAARSGSFWLREATERQAQWEAVRLAAELGIAIEAVQSELAKPPSDASTYVDRYASTWHRADRAQRQFEAWLPKLEDDPDEHAVVAVRERYEKVVADEARGFAAALQSAGWSVDEPIQQTAIYDDVVRATSGRVAYFLVDAMRYEMGAELADRLAVHADVTLRPAVGVLPSITCTGMAALMPGASLDYHVAENAGRLVAKLNDTILPDLAARKKYFSARVPASVDLTLDEVLTLGKTKLMKKIGKADCVVVRSQEIDAFGEGGFLQARAIMDTVIENLARAVRKLATAGVERAVVTADHGHLYSAEDREDWMRIDAPGGETVELHRRCWIGRGGATPATCVRVSARTLGNDTDLDFVFPVGTGVFRAGGDLAFHHGGPSLQELIIPVITARSVGAAPETSGGAGLSISDVPAEITNRIFSVKVSITSLETEAVSLRPVLMSGESQVGSVGMAVGAEYQRSSGSIALVSGTEATIGFVLDDDAVESLKIVVLDPATDAELYRSPDPLLVRLGVS